MLKECIYTVSLKYAKWEVLLEEEYLSVENRIIEGDFFQLKILFCNILDNAYQALSEKKGRITVALRFQTDEYCQIAVRDNGLGLAQEELKNIFEPFYTTKSKGTGLGLTICKEIIALHQGRLEVESVKGKGSTFSIVLPIHRQR